MKKYIVIVLLLVIFVTGCKNDNFSLEEKYYDTASLIEIDDSKFNELVDNKESFAILIYESSCTTSSEFSKVVEDFSEKYKLYLYSISFKNMKETSLSDKVKFCPSFAIYKKGKLIDFLDASSDEDTEVYKDVDNFSNWFFSYVNKQF